MAVKRGRSISSFGQLFGAISGGTSPVDITPELISHKDIDEIRNKVMAEITGKTLITYGSRDLSEITSKSLIETGEKNVTQYGG